MLELRTATEAVNHQVSLTGAGLVGLQTRRSRAGRSSAGRQGGANLRQPEVLADLTGEGLVVGVEAERPGQPTATGV